MLTATLAIGFSASAATAPLISHTFGQISVVGLALNPVVILLSYVVVGSCTLWLVIRERRSHRSSRSSQDSQPGHRTN